MQFIKKQIFLLVAFILPLFAYSQSGFELMSVDLTRYPQSQFNGDKGEFKTPLNFFIAKINLPVLRAEKAVLLNGVNFGYLDIINSEVSKHYPYPKDIKSVGYNARLIKKLDKSALLINSELQFSSDNFSEFSINKMVLRGGFALLKKYDYENIRVLGIGIGGSTDYGIPTVIPIVFLVGSLSNKLSYKAILPVVSKINYSFSPNLNVGIQHSVRFSSFHFSDVKNENEFGKIRNICPGMYLERKLFKQFYIATEGGFYIKNLLRLYNSTSELNDEYEAKANYFFNLKLSLKITRNETGLF